MTSPENSDDIIEEKEEKKSKRGDGETYDLPEDLDELSTEQMLTILSNLTDYIGKFDRQFPAGARAATNYFQTASSRPQKRSTGHSKLNVGKHRATHRLIQQCEKVDSKLILTFVQLRVEHTSGKAEKSVDLDAYEADLQQAAYEAYVNISKLADPNYDVKSAEDALKEDYFHSYWHMYAVKYHELTGKKSSIVNFNRLEEDQTLMQIDGQVLAKFNNSTQGDDIFKVLGWSVERRKVEIDDQSQINSEDKKEKEKEDEDTDDDQGEVEDEDEEGIGSKQLKENLWDEAESILLGNKAIEGWRAKRKPSARMQKMAIVKRPQLTYPFYLIVRWGSMSRTYKGKLDGWLQVVEESGLVISDHGAIMTLLNKLLDEVTKGGGKLAGVEEKVKTDSEHSLNYKLVIDYDSKSVKLTIETSVGYTLANHDAIGVASYADQLNNGKPLYWIGDGQRFAFASVSFSQTYPVAGRVLQLLARETLNDKNRREFGTIQRERHRGPHRDRYVVTGTPPGGWTQQYFQNLVDLLTPYLKDKRKFVYKP